MGIIVDAQVPRSTTGGKWMTQLKIFDQSIQGEGESTYVNMFGYSINDLPQVSAIGDILYLKKAQKREFKEKAYLLYNVSVRSWWGIFKGVSQKY